MATSCDHSLIVFGPTMTRVRKSHIPHFIIWGFPQMGISQWLVDSYVFPGIYQSKMDENWGYPHDLGNLHLVVAENLTTVVLQN